jgi:hypothetical protein
MSLDFYCERLGTEFWSEPINALTNLSFIIAGFWGLSKKPKSFSLYLSLLSLTIGIGSFLFHTFATKLTQLADLIPIFLFTLVFVFYTFLKVLNLSKRLSVVLSVIFVLLMVLIEILVPKSILGGSVLYVPALFTLFAVAVLTSSRNKQLSKFYAFVGLVFFMSLVFRTIDLQICDVFPLGTHFLWHLLNGLAVGLMIQITLPSNQHP